MPDALSSVSQLEPFLKLLPRQSHQFIADESLRPACHVVVTSVAIAELVFLGEIRISLVQGGIISVTQHGRM